MLITLAVNWAVTEIMVFNINYNCLVIYAEQSNTYYEINLNSVSITRSFTQQ
jgi:hypothetical protein